MQYILFVILSFLIGTILFYLSNNICEPFTIGNDIQLSQNLNLTESCACNGSDVTPEFFQELTNINGVMTLTSNFTIGEKEYIIINKNCNIQERIVLTNNGQICITEGFYLHNLEGKIANNGTINNNSSIYNDGSIESSGIITNYNRINNNGTTTNNGSGIIINDKDGEINNNGTITNNGSGIIINDKDGEINNYWNFVSDSGTITNHNRIDNIGTINNSSKITNSGSGNINNTGNISNNRGNITNYATINNYIDGNIDNTNGIICGNGTIKGTDSIIGNPVNPVCSE